MGNSKKDRKSISPINKQPSICKSVILETPSNEIEIVTLKRLNFLRTSLDQHDPKETTQRIRAQAKQRRD